MSAGSPESSDLVRKDPIKITATELNQALQNYPNKQFIFDLVMTLLLATYAPRSLLRLDATKSAASNYQDLSEKDKKALAMQIKQILNPDKRYPPRKVILDVLCLHLDVILDPEESDLYPLVAEVFAPNLDPAPFLSRFLEEHFPEEGTHRCEIFKAQIQKHYPPEEALSLTLLAQTSSQAQRRWLRVDYVLLVLVTLLYILSEHYAWQDVIHAKAENERTSFLKNLLPLCIGLAVGNAFLRRISFSQSKIDAESAKLKAQLHEKFSRVFNFADPDSPSSASPPTKSSDAATAEASAAPLLAPCLRRQVSTESEKEQRQAWALQCTDAAMQERIAKRKAAKTAKQESARRAAGKTASVALTSSMETPSVAPLSSLLLRINGGEPMECPLLETLEHLPLLETASTDNPVVVRFPPRCSEREGPVREEFIIIPRKTWNEMEDKAQSFFLRLILECRPRQQGRDHYEIEGNYHTFKNRDGTRLYARINESAKGQRIGHYVSAFGNFHKRDGSVVLPTTQAPECTFE